MKGFVCVWNVYDLNILPFFLLYTPTFITIYKWRLYNRFDRKKYRRKSKLKSLKLIKMFNWHLQNSPQTSMWIPCFTKNEMHFETSMNNLHILMWSPTLQTIDQSKKILKTNCLCAIQLQQNYRYVVLHWNP